MNERFAAHLNYYYSDLNVSIDKNADPAEVYRELSLLEEVLHGKIQIPARSLPAVACPCLAECGGVCR